MVVLNLFSFFHTRFLHLAIITIGLLGERVLAKSLYLKVTGIEPYSDLPSISDETTKTKSISLLSRSRRQRNLVQQQQMGFNSKSDSDSESLKYNSSKVNTTQIAKVNTTKQTAGPDGISSVDGTARSHIDSGHSYTEKSDPTQPKPPWVNNRLAEFFFNYTEGHVIWKWHNYFNVYNRYLSPLVPYTAPTILGGKGSYKVNILVLGVQSGGEIGMWRDFFSHANGGDSSNFYYYGIDINPACKQLETVYPNTKIFIGDQGDEGFLMKVKDQILADGGVINAILDDGSHINWHQIFSFEKLYPFLADFGGIYIVEDTTTSYNPRNDIHRIGSPAIVNLGYQGSTESDTLVEHMKHRVDYVNGYWTNPKDAPYDKFTSTIQGISFFDGMVVIEKYPHSHPTQEQRGTIDIPYCTNGQANGCMT